MTTIPEIVSTSVHKVYSSLPKRGKPQGSEWTVLAGIVATQTSSVEPCRVLTIASGNKCVGRGRMSSEGSVVNDCHAEILSRRALVRYLLLEVEDCLQREGGRPAAGSLLELDAGAAARRIQPYRLRKDIDLHLYVSDTPCGDASIFRDPTSDHHVRVTGAKAADFSLGAGGKSGETGRNQNQEQTLGVLRTKSGRSDLQALDRTLSMSCSDKIARWTQLGLQGGLLSHLLQPLYLSTVVVGAAEYACALRKKHRASDEVDSRLAPISEAIERAVVHRVANFRLGKKSTFPSPPPVKVELCTRVLFPHSRLARNFAASCSTCEPDTQGEASSSTCCPPQGKKRRMRAPPSCGLALNWTEKPPYRISKHQNSNPPGLYCNGGMIEVLVSATGRRQGANRKGPPSKKTRSRLCKALLFEKFAQVVTELRAGPNATLEPSTLESFCCDAAHLRPCCDAGSSGFTSSIGVGTEAPLATTNTSTVPTGTCTSYREAKRMAETDYKGRVAFQNFVENSKLGIWVTAPENLEDFTAAT